MTKENSNNLSRNGALKRIERALRSPVPNEREHLLYYQVNIEGQPEDVVAARFGLTLDGLHVVMLRVHRWISQADLPIDTRNTLAQHLARLEHQWSMAMSAWHRSCETEVIEKTSEETTPGKEKKEKEAKEDGEEDADKKDVCPAAKATHRRDDCAADKSAAKKSKTERITRRACGDVRYLEQARKIMAEIRTLSAVADERAKNKKEPVDVEKLSLDERITEAVERIVQIREDAARPEAEDQ